MPICPHCEQQVTELKETMQKRGFRLHITRIYSCPYCDKVLGVGSHV